MTELNLVNDIFDIPDPRFGKIKITGHLLNLIFTNAMKSEINVLDMLEYDRANDTWIFLCSGPDFDLHPEGCPVPHVDAGNLRENREYRESVEEVFGD